MRSYLVRQIILLMMSWLGVMGNVTLAKEDSVRTELMMFVRDDREARIQRVEELKKKVQPPSEIEIKEHEDQE